MPTTNGSAQRAPYETVLRTLGDAGIRLQLLFGASIPHDVLLSLPYLATILGVWISGRTRGGAKAATEASELRDY